MHQVDVERQPPGAGDLDLGGSARIPALLDITCGSALVKTTTSPASTGIGSPPTRLAKQRPWVTT
jgi:hypothetical protein